ncbi:hypothetical protein FUAX_19310 [Fulvitalea axinellae]|uniref:DUF304 domain-containing protein n=1 Tax=Fulvitalea axinellae TaxID=1182444 RepID=A0AAU9D4V7_9BACT|nr:hypothetical protein FUAX_19310 [Fulvitalea axinellae]
MNSQELQKLLLRGHEQDKKYTFVQYGVNLFLASFFFYFMRPYLYRFLGPAFEFELGSNVFHLTDLLIPVLVIGMVIHFFTTVLNRPTHIAVFCLEVENDRKASFVQHGIEYKVIIRLPRARRIKMCPIDYVQICLEGDKKVYRFPLDSPIHTKIERMLCRKPRAHGYVA